VETYACEVLQIGPKNLSYFETFPHYIWEYIFT
jgi:hypothetical protein